MKTDRSRSGLTLIELMVVVIIIAALAGMVLPKVLPASRDAKRRIAKGEIGSITTALKLYYLHNDRFPSTDEGLDALISQVPSAKNWHGPHLDGDDYEDPWRRSYRYRHPGTQSSKDFDIWSVGEDGQEGTADDVSNWKKD